MTRNPIKNPSAWAALFFASSALAAGPFPEATQDKAATFDPSPCAAGEAYTCKIQCVSTTRTFWERWVNNAGVEACVNLGCICEPKVITTDIDDPRVPTILVIFGVRQLLVKPPQP